MPRSLGRVLGRLSAGRALSRLSAGRVSSLRRTAPFKAASLRRVVLGRVAL